MSKRRRGGVCCRLSAIAGISLLLPRQAEAHTPVKGLGEFASGFLHPLLTLPHVVVLIALGLLLGQRRPLRLAAPAITVAAFGAAGLLLTGTGITAGVYQPVLIVIGLCAGVFVALALPLPPWFYLATCASAALAISLDSGVDPGTPAAAVVKTLFGTWVSLVLFVFNVAFYVSLLPKLQWILTGIRVVGSWIVAIALLMLAFAFRR